MLRLAFLLILSLVSTTLAAPTPAGALLEVQASGIQFLGTHVVKDAIDHLQRISIPNIPEQEFKCLGKCYFDISNILISGLKCSGATSFSFAANQGIHAVLSGCSVSVAADWKLHRSTFPSFTCHGSVDGSFTGLGINAVVGIQKTSQNSIFAQMTSSQIHLDNDKMSFHGGLCSLLGDIVKGLIEGAIKKEFNTALGNKLPGIVNPILAKYTLPTQLALKPIQSTINIPVTAAPIVTTATLILPFLGQFTPQSPPRDKFNQSVPTFDSSAVPTEMARLGLSTFFFNSLAFSAYEQNLMIFRTTSKILDLGLDITASMTSPPSVSTITNATAGNLKLSLAGSLQAVVSNSSLGFAVEVQASIPIFVRASDQTISAALGSFNISDIAFDVVNSTIHIDVSILDEWVSNFLNGVLTPYINGILLKGLTIPLVEKIGLANTVFTSQGNFVFCDTNFVEKSAFQESPHRGKASKPL